MTTKTNARKARTGVRTSREQTTHEAEGVHDDIIDFEPQGPLPDISARPGYAQRWVRAVRDGKPDAHNLFAAARRGWLARKPETVPQTLQWLTVQREGIGGCIGTHDMVLMERHSELDAREASVKRRDRRERERAVKNNLFSEYRSIRNAGGGDLVTAPEMENSARVERGRAPVIQDD